VPPLLLLGFQDLILGNNARWMTALPMAFFDPNVPLSRLERLKKTKGKTTEESKKNEVSSSVTVVNDPLALHSAA
jgi:hypothetical protein